jgi:hypothetical protein
MKRPKRVTVCEVGTRDGFVEEIVGRALPGQIAKAGKWSRRYPLPDGVQSRLAARYA